MKTTEDTEKTKQPSFSEITSAEVVKPEKTKDTIN